MTDTSIIASGRQVGKDSYIFFTLRGEKGCSMREILSKMCPILRQIFLGLANWWDDVL